MKRSIDKMKERGMKIGDKYRIDDWSRAYEGRIATIISPTSKRYVDFNGTYVCVRCNVEGESDSFTLNIPIAALHDI